MIKMDNSENAENELKTLRKKLLKSVWEAIGIILYCIILFVTIYNYMVYKIEPGNFALFVLITMHMQLYSNKR